MESMSDPDRDEPPDDHVEIPLGSRTVQDAYRVSLPLDFLGFSEGDTVDVYIEPGEDGDFEPFVIPELPIRSDGRVTIPKYRRDDRDVGVGDAVRVTVRAPAGEWGR